jgi:ABC-type nickel/cobalt efflux system permease component RcnA
MNRRRSFSLSPLVSLALLAAAWCAGPAQAHPVPKKSHDRLITVHLTPEGVRVEYHLEADAWTVVYVDLPAVDDQVDLTKLSQPKDFYESYTRVYAPILANNLSGILDGKPLTFRCAKHGWQDKDSIWCDYVFETPWQPGRDARRIFAFREGNYELESGQIKLSLVADPGITLLEKTEPDEALKNRPPTQLLPGDDARLRKAAAVFTVTTSAGGEAKAIASSPSPKNPVAGQGAEAQPATPAAIPRQSSSLFNLLLDSRQGFVALLLAAAVFGAAHALTPGHGKTLVAAYLVGERGTAWHAVLLGLVTTLTHTGAVIVLALVAGWFLPQAQVALALVAGLMVVVLGLWKLFRSLAGQADHFHLPGTGRHHHHHHGDDPHQHDHDHADHYHDEQGHVHPLPAGKRSIGSWGLIVLGISGGIVPCVDAIAMFGLAVEMQRVWLALPLLLSFSAGLAGVLIAIGLAVVWAKGLAQARYGDHPRFRQVFRALPVVSAALITCLGIWLCRDIVQGTGDSAPVPAAASQP